MDFNWVFYAVVLFVVGGSYFFNAIATRIQIGRSRAENIAITPLQTKSPSKEIPLVDAFPHLSSPKSLSSVQS